MNLYVAAAEAVFLANERLRYRRNIENPLSLFGLFSVSDMLVFYALERRSPGWILAFAAACILGAAYGFLQGAWQFGVVEAVWSEVAIRRWRLTD